MRLKKLLLAGLTSLSADPLAASQALSERNTPRKVVVFVADGLRAASVNDQTAPAMAKLAREGVSFTNSHSLFPTLTMANASALVTAHVLGDTGTFGNTLYVGFEVRSANSVTPFLERDDVLVTSMRASGTTFSTNLLCSISPAPRATATRRLGRSGLRFYSTMLREVRSPSSLMTPPAMSTPALVSRKECRCPMR
jgi:hypothetical protein